MVRLHDSMTPLVEKLSHIGVEFSINSTCPLALQAPLKNFKDYEYVFSVVFAKAFESLRKSFMFRLYLILTLTAMHNDVRKLCTWQEGVLYLSINKSASLSPLTSFNLLWYIKTIIYIIDFMELPYFPANLYSAKI